jgi:hypothetical protein
MGQYLHLTDEAMSKKLDEIIAVNEKAKGLNKETLIKKSDNDKAKDTEGYNM